MVRKNKYGGRRGWFNNSKKHSLAAKGIKTKRTDSSNFRLQFKERPSGFTQKGFNRLTQAQQRGNIIDLAKKSFAGMKHAVEWEREHLPNQARWVRDEYHEAKTATRKTYDALKKGSEPAIAKSKEWLQEHTEKAKHNADDFLEELKKAPTISIDRKEVADEKDHNEDGTPDITDQELDQANNEIKESLGQKAGKFFAEKKAQQFKEAVKVIETKGTAKEKKILLGNPDDVDIAKLSDHTIEELAIRTKPGLIFGGNVYETELLKRREKRADLKLKKKELDKKLDERRQALNKKLRKKEEPLFSF